MSKIILVVEDDDAIREVYVEVLETEGYKVMTARNGAEALKLLKSNYPLPDLVLTDLMMPIMNGQQLVQMIRNDRVLKFLPIVVISAFNSAELLGLDYLTKPFEIESFIKKIEEYCGEKNEAPMSAPVKMAAGVGVERLN